MKKFIINLSLIVIAIFVYILQENFFSWFTISGVMPNLFIIYVLFIGLFAKKAMGTVYGIFIGLIIDLLVETKIGVNAFLLGAVGFLAATFDKNFSKDSRITIMLIVLGTTIAYETLSYFVNFAIYNFNIEIISFMRTLAIEAIYNVILTIIFYSAIKKLGYYIEEEYGKSKILTKYF